MAKKRNMAPSSEERKQSELNDLQKRLDWISEPPERRKVQIGDSVIYGHLQNVVVADVLENGRILEVDYTSVDNNYGNPIRTDHERRYVAWVDVVPKKKEMSIGIKNEDLILRYSNRTIGDIFSKMYHFGVELEPEYQRGWVWEPKDQILLIESMFSNIDIGKFVFARNSYKEVKLYEALDGANRIRTLINFYEDRFSFQGVYYSDLSPKEQNHFEGYMINMAEIEEPTLEQKLRYFLMLNTSGKPVDPKHLEKVRKQLEELQKAG